MTALITISCDGEWNGMPCRGTLPIPAARVTRPRDDDAADLYAARIVAFEAGWRQTPAGIGDLCPAHARHQQYELLRPADGEQVTPELAAELRAAFGQPS